MAEISPLSAHILVCGNNQLFSLTSCLQPIAPLFIISLYLFSFAGLCTWCHWTHHTSSLWLFSSYWSTSDLFLRNTVFSPSASLISFHQSFICFICTPTLSTFRMLDSSAHPVPQYGGITFLYWMCSTLHILFSAVPVECLFLGCGSAPLLFSIKCVMCVVLCT